MTLIVIYSLTPNGEALFRRGSSSYMNRYLKMGYDVTVLDALPEHEWVEGSPGKSNLAQWIRNAFANVQDLARIQVYSHAGRDINLTTNPQADLHPNRKSIALYNGDYTVNIRDISIEHPIKDRLNGVDVFGCNKYDSDVGKEFANVTGWKTRTVKPGLGCYFPSFTLTCTPAARKENNMTAIWKIWEREHWRFDKQGWILWTPGKDQPEPTSAPAYD